MAIDEISIASFALRFDNKLDLIDVREVDEYESGHVSGAVNIPLSEFVGRLNEIPKTTVFFICRSGSRSMQACEICVDAGLTSVINVAGGTMGWIAAGREVVLGGQPE